VVNFFVPISSNLTQRPTQSDQNILENIAGIFPDVSSHSARDPRPHLATSAGRVADGIDKITHSYESCLGLLEQFKQEREVES
jgi:hypothetical protein